MKFKVRFDRAAITRVQKKLEDLQTPITRDEAASMGAEAVRAMKTLIASGISPVRGPGIPTRFERYKNPDRYPGSRKNKTPVNLKLTGKMLSNLAHSTKRGARGWDTEIGYDDPEQRIKEKGHREGAGGQPVRVTIPIPSRGETFAVQVQQVLIKHVDAALKRILRR